MFEVLDEVQWGFNRENPIWEEGDNMQVKGMWDYYHSDPRQHCFDARTTFELADFNNPRWGNNGTVSYMYNTCDWYDY